LAILISNEEDIKTNTKFDICKERVEFYNYAIVKVALEQIFSNSKEQLNGI